MAFQAIPRCGGMDCTFYLGGIFVGVAGKTQPIRRGRDQLNVGCISGIANLVTRRAAHGDRGMHRLTLGFVLVAGHAGCGIRLRFEWHRMLRRVGRARKHERDDEPAQRDRYMTRSTARFEQC